MPTMKIIEKRIDEINEYEGNPRDTADAVDLVAKSIESFGWKQPIVIDKSNVIVAGHTRYRAAIKLGLETVPVVIADDLSDDEIKAYRIIDNRTSEFSTWNLERLMSELATIELNLDDWKLDCLLDVEPPEIPDVKGIDFKPKFGVVVDCANDEEQKTVFELVKNAGYSPRLVSI
jgi:hypothetical protein